MRENRTPGSVRGAPRKGRPYRDGKRNMIIPYGTEVLIKKWPISNIAIMGGCIISFIVLLTGGFSPPSA